ncbi:MAG: phosphatase PAP2 family protein [Patescibacteria group bacterium]
MLHFDEHLTTQIREAGKSTLPLWRFLASYGIVVLFGFGVVTILLGYVSWFVLLIPVALTHAITLGLQHIVGRARPPLGVSEIQMWYRTPSFPSAHSAGSMAFAVAMSAVMLRVPQYGIPLGIALIVFALLIGISRIMAGVHYLGDVLAGFLFGILVTGIFLTAV